VKKAFKIYQDLFYYYKAIDEEDIHYKFWVLPSGYLIVAFSFIVSTAIF
jgi:hypothetical protein